MPIPSPIFVWRGECACGNPAKPADRSANAVRRYRRKQAAKSGRRVRDARLVLPEEPVCEVCAWLDGAMTNRYDIICELRDRGRLSVVQLADAVGASTDTTYATLKRMMADGRVESVSDPVIEINEYEGEAHNIAWRLTREDRA